MDRNIDKSTQALVREIEMLHTLVLDKYTQQLKKDGHDKADSFFAEWLPTANEALNYLYKVTGDSKVLRERLKSIIGSLQQEYELRHSTKESTRSLIVCIYTGLPEKIKILERMSE